MKKLFLLPFLFLSAACTPDYYEITFDSNPKGAKVYVEDEYAGETPVVAKVKTDNMERGKSTQVILQKEGYIIYEFHMKHICNNADYCKFEKDKYFKALEEKYLDTAPRKMTSTKE
jgi:pullulanase/glycogen debranching enzyme